MFIRLIIFLIFFAISVGSMALARRLGLQASLGLVLVAVLTCAAVGAFFAMAGSAMATSVNPQAAQLKGAGIGGGLGLLSGLLWLGILNAMRK